MVLLLLLLLPTCAAAADPPTDRVVRAIGPPNLPRIRLGARLRCRIEPTAATEVRVLVELTWKLGAPSPTLRLRPPDDEEP